MTFVKFIVLIMSNSQSKPHTRQNETRLGNVGEMMLVECQWMAGGCREVEDQTNKEEREESKAGGGGGGGVKDT